VPESDGRRVQIAWALTPAPKMPFNQSLLFPVELTLHSTDDGIKMYAYPVEEIKSLYTEEFSWSKIELEPSQNLLSKVDGDLLDINAEFQIEDSDEFGFIIKNKKIRYDASRKVLSCDGEEAELQPAAGKIQLRILVDTMTIEIYANNGRIYMPVRAYPDQNNPGIELFTAKNIIINSLEINELKSIWN
jgi:fructan beta-fructosidase